MRASERPLGVLDERGWLAVQARQLQELPGDVADGGEPFVCGAFVGLAVEFERLVRSAEGYRAARIGVVEQSVHERGVACPGSTWITWIATLSVAHGERRLPAWRRAGGSKIQFAFGQLIAGHMAAR